MLMELAEIWERLCAVFSTAFKLVFFWFSYIFPSSQATYPGMSLCLVGEFAFPSTVSAAPLPNTRTLHHFFLHHPTVFLLLFLKTILVQLYQPPVTRLSREKDSRTGDSIARSLNLCQQILQLVQTTVEGSILLQFWCCNLLLCL